MQKITYTINNQETGFIHWGIAEHFDELRGKTFKISEMDAAQVEKINDLSLTAKILLSAVAGAVMQHLMDKGVDFELMFNTGVFEVN